jgi:hypothetical protein
MQAQDGGTLRVLDLTKEQPDPPDFSPPHHKIIRDKLKRRDVVFRRAVNTIDGIVVHQTATPFGVSKAAVKAAGGDVELAKHRRALGVAAHMTAFDTGTAVLAHPIEWYVYHGNALNARSLGLEVEGLFPGTMGKKELFAGNLELASRDGLEYLVRKGREAGMPIKYIWAHRQSSMTRVDDPGEEIWRKLVLGFAVPMLGLSTQSEYVSGGRTIPPEWKPEWLGVRR